MTKMTKKWIIGLCAFTLALGGGSFIAFAEDATVPEGPAIKERFEKRRAKIEELKKLKQENPAEFERLMKERKEKIRAKLADLKEKDPEKYRRFKEKMKHRREHYRDRREDKWDRREDRRDQGLHRGEYKGVRDHGRGLGRGKGQGAVKRNGGADGRHNG